MNLFQPQSFALNRNDHYNYFKGRMLLFLFSIQFSDWHLNVVKVSLYTQCEESHVFTLSSNKNCRKDMLKSKVKLY